MLRPHIITDLVLTAQAFQRELRYAVNSGSLTVADAEAVEALSRALGDFSKKLGGVA